MSKPKRRKSPAGSKKTELSKGRTIRDTAGLAATVIGAIFVPNFYFQALFTLVAACFVVDLFGELLGFAHASMD